MRAAGWGSEAREENRPIPAALCLVPY